MSGTGNILLVTGVPGSGKTTVIRKVATALPDVRITGFYTEEIRVNNIRQGFELVTFHGQRFVMARVNYQSSYKVGRYGVDVAVIDKAAEKNLSENSDSDLYIIDEIGRMECFSTLFVRRMSSLLDSEKTVIATVALKGGGFIAEVKKRPGIELWEVTRKNRQGLPERIVNWIRLKLQNS